jgi:hypothetical protein
MPEAPATNGLFVVNVRDAEWLTSESDKKKPSGVDCAFESQESPFAQLGIRLHALPPGVVLGPSSVGVAKRVLRPLYTPLMLR